MKNVIKQYFYAITLSLCIFAPQKSCAQTTQTFQQCWAETALQRLDDQELSLLANFVYFDFICSMYDAQIRAQINSLRKALPIIQACSENYQEIPLSMEEFATITKQVQDLLPLQRSAFKTWYACRKEIDLDSRESLQEIISQLAQHARNAINAELANNNDTIISLYQKMDDTLGRFNQKILFSQRFFKGMADNNSPFCTPEKEDQIAANLSAVFSLTNSIMENDNELYDGVYIIKEIGVNLLKLNTDIFADCYQSLYEQLSVNKPYTLIIQYDEMGKLPLHKQTQSLPSIQEFFQ